MNRRKRHLVPSITVLVVAAAASGCVNNDVSFVIERFVPITQATQCSVSPDSTDSLNGGILDVGVSAENYGGYFAGAVVMNQLLKIGSTSSVETNGIQVTGLQVELRPTKGTALDGAIPKAQRKFFVPAAGGLAEPGGGKVGVIAEVIPEALAISLASTVATGENAVPETLIVRVHPVGKHAGMDIDGGSVDFPVKICKFCLTAAPSACPMGGYDPNQVLSDGCYPEQDVPVTCCKSGGVTVCGKSVPMKTGI